MKVKYGQTLENKKREAVRGVIFKDDQLGIIKVNKYDCYIFPGGGIDEGEDIKEALKRELEEEAGLIVNVKDHILTTETAEYQFTHVNHFYLCEIEDVCTPSHTDVEIDLNIEFQWIDITELYDYYLNYQDDLRFGEENKLIQRSIKSRGFLLLTLLDRRFDMGLTKRWIGKEVEATIDRPIGYKAKPEHNPYPINYGYIENVFSLDGGEIDCYCLDATVPQERISGKVIGYVKRFDDIEDKLIISNKNLSKEEVESAVHFIEQYFDSIIVLGGEV